MDTEVQSSPPQENGSKIQESTSDPPDDEAAIVNGKDEPKTPMKPLIVRETRSRSRTPQKKKDKKNDDSAKTNLKKIDEAVNGHEEKKTEKKTERVDNNALKNGDSGNSDDIDKKELKRSLRKHKQQEESSENGKPNDKEEAETVGSEESASVKNEAETVGSETPVVNSNSLKAEVDAVEMDPLVLAGDEADPELQFDENSDMDSGKGSPILARCKTRRSHTRNISTPKTPKSLTDSESGQNSVAPTPTPENVDTSDSLNTESVSTTAQVGSDTTRLDYVNDDTSVFYAEDSSYLVSSRDKSLSETLRCLSARKTIRPLNDSYRLRAFKNNQNKTDLNLPYDDSQDLVARVNAVKRKRSASPEGSKKLRTEPGLVSYLSSPLTNFRNRFISDVNSSTPKLTGYKDNSHDLHEGVGYSEVVSEEHEKKNKCLVM